jgi:hypothetical protein
MPKIQQVLTGISASACRNLHVFWQLQNKTAFKKPYINGELEGR